MRWLEKPFFQLSGCAGNFIRAVSAAAVVREREEIVVLFVCQPRRKK